MWENCGFYSMEENWKRIIVERKFNEMKNKLKMTMLRKGRKVVYLSLESRKNYENWGNFWSKEIGGNEISLISRERNKEE